MDAAQLSGNYDVMTESLNADFSKGVVLDTSAMAWQPSPSPTVWRKRLDLVGGGESGKVTSVVRYDAKASFPVHGHPEGEEILVLKGIFSDEHGDFPAGTYLLNPPGFRHAPFSRKGCTIFVKLRQYGGERREHVVVETATATWAPGPVPGIDVLPLYRSERHPETMDLLHVSGGARLSHQACPGGAEIFVLDGVLVSDDGDHGAGSWLRLPDGAEWSLASKGKKGCTLYAKRGHLAAAAPVA
jgi:anti-sigma factor ChrR (cupin superfamily)